MSKIIVAGDSIAYGKWDSEGGWVTRLRKYVDDTYNLDKGGNFQVYNLGIPGEVVPRLAKRFEQELTIRLPKGEGTNERNLVILAVGINDSCPNNWMTQQQTSEIEFKEAFEKLIETSFAKQCKVAVIGLTPVNPSKSKGLLFSDEEVAKYNKYISDVCDQKGIPMLNLFEKLRNIRFADNLVDAVHPNNEGHKLLTEKVKDFLQSTKLFDYLTS